jgi:hypothetical protein
MSVSEVSDILWQERHLLELLLFKLEEQQLVLSSGHKRWVHHAAREVELVLDEITRAERTRTIEVDAAAAEMGLSAGPTVHELTEAAEETWTEVFDEHRRAYVAITEEIFGVAEVNRDLLTRVESATEEALRWLGDGDVTADAHTGGTTSNASASPRLVNDAS